VPAAGQHADSQSTKGGPFKVVKVSRISKKEIPDKESSSDARVRPSRAGLRWRV
jgi:hypothetical protein